MSPDPAEREPMPPPFVISDLRQRPEFLGTVADRLWQSWWRDSAHPLSFIAGRLREENLNAHPIPFALIAHDGESFLGTASVIASDLAERPELTPWVAAVWVEPRARRRGVGRALVERAAQDCFALGVSHIHLCARPQLSRFYEGLGWRPIEWDVGPRRLGVFIRDANPGGCGISRSPP
jgi:GNAT superfamily N-acetyltransferase